MTRPGPHPALAGTRPFEFSIQSETSVASVGDDVLVAYKSSADTPFIQTPDGRLLAAHAHQSAFSVSHDGGLTWTSGFVPPAPPPSVNLVTLGSAMVAADRAANFYYASVGTHQPGRFAVIINKSTDRGRTFAPAVVVAQDDGVLKPWLAVGRDPVDRTRDNLYRAWASLQRAAPGGPFTSAPLRFARSTDGGATWTARTIFASEEGGPGGLSAFTANPTPIVDASSGRLYIPFLHFRRADADLLKVLVSDDAGATFQFLEFNVPGAPDRFGFPNVTPGELADCGTTGGFQQVLHQGLDLGGGRVFESNGRTFQRPRYRQASAVGSTRPSAAVAAGRLFLAIHSSTRAVQGDRTGRSTIRLLFSADGGASWAAPVTVAAATDADPQHVEPSLTVDSEGERVHVAYYVQQANEQVRVDLASGEVEHGTVRFEPEGVQRVSSVAFDLTPHNNPIPTPTDPFLTTNYDRAFPPCVDLGEYLGTSLAHESVIAAWTDNRNRWTSPPESPAAGTHLRVALIYIYSFTGTERRRRCSGCAGA